jgi:hypothetical protein
VFSSPAGPIALRRCRPVRAPEILVQHRRAHRGDRFRDVFALEQLVALRVDDLALIVGDVVVLEQLFANVEVARFDLALCRFQ